MKKSREDIFSVNPFFTNFLLDMQLDHYEPKVYKEGDDVFFLGMKESEILTKEKAKKLNEKEKDDFEKGRDKFDRIKVAKKKNIEVKFIISSKKDHQNYLKDLGTFLERLRVILKEEKLMILGIWNTPWLIQENDYYPARVALDYLKTRIDSNFAGGFFLKGEELIEFLPHLFWITRCNMSLPYFYMAFAKSTLIINLCKYGVLHIQIFTKNDQQVIETLLKEMKLTEIRTCNDPIEFDDFEGRKLEFIN